METKKKISNRNSLIRVIISNYDDKGIKEIKVRYNKQAQLDSFSVESEIIQDEQNKAKFKLNNIDWNRKETYRYSVEKNIISENEVEFMKKDKFLNKIIRKYGLSFEISDKNSRVVVVGIEDRLDENIQKCSDKNSQERVARRLKSNTERKLLDKETQNYYAKIANCPSSEIDSLKIYKIKRYLNYRSTMLIYFAFINDFLCENNDVKSYNIKNNEEEEVKEIWKMKNNNSNVIIDEKKVIECISEKLLFKIKSGINDYHNRKKDKNEEEIEELTIEEMKEDVKKILDIYIELRHKLAHFDYEYFEKLFENKNDDLTEKLNLNIFRYVKLSKKLRIENQTNCLDDDTEFSILNRIQNAKKCSSFYNTICENKNGFNNFINSLFVDDGQECKIFKEEINKQLDEDLKNIEKRIEDQNSKEKKNKKLIEKLKKEHELLKTQKEELKTAYVWDIHSHLEYKKLYNERKNTVQKYNLALQGSKNKKELREVGKKLVDLKKRMENITKRNAIIRLKYKLQVAYAFLMIEFDGDIERLKKEFDISKIDKIGNYRSRRIDYLKGKFDKEKQIKFDIKEMAYNNIEKIIKEREENWLDNIPSNNLFKFYVLTYILLPVELKGDFLGFVKKHYYDIKNTDFDRENKELTNEELDKKIEEMKNDSFFHKVRLFEKNSKKYDIFKNTILHIDRINSYFRELGLEELKHKNIVKGNGEEKSIFNKNIVMPIFKYYQLLLKLYNDVEILVLLYISMKENKDIKTVIEEVSTNEKGEKTFYNLNLLFKKLGNTKLVLNIRNSILHLNYTEFIDSLLKLNIEEEKLVITEKLRKRKEFQLDVIFKEFLKFINTYKKYFVKEGIDEDGNLNTSFLDYNYLNDFFMKREQFIFGQLKQINKVSIDTEDKKQDEKDRELRKFCRLQDGKLEFKDLNKIYKVYNILRNICEKEDIITYQHITKNKELREAKLELDNIKIGDKKLSELNDVEKIKGRLYRYSSDLLGLYKREVIKIIKAEIIKKLIYQEEKILTLNFYNKDENKRIYEEIILIREKATNNFYFYDLEAKSKSLTKSTKIKGISLEIREDKDEKYNLYFKIDDNIKTNFDIEKNIIDLRKYYSFNKIINFSY